MRPEHGFDWRCPQCLLQLAIAGAVLVMVVLDIRKLLKPQPVVVASARSAPLEQENIPPVVVG